MTARAAPGRSSRGSLLGSFLGTLPGGGSILAAFSSYTLEKRLSRHPERFGKGAIEGVAGPESANNAGAQTSFIPLLTLGIPSHPLMALMIGALMIQGITPGPNVVNEQPALFWGVIASMWIGNAMLIVLNLPLVGLWVTMLKIPYRVLLPAIVAFSMIGVFTVNNSGFEVCLLAVFGLIGYLFSKLGCEPAPFLMGFVLGALLEEHLRRALVFSNGRPERVRDRADQRGPARASPCWCWRWSRFRRSPIGGAKFLPTTKRIESRAVFRAELLHADRLDEVLDLGDLLPDRLGELARGGRRGSRARLRQQRDELRLADRLVDRGVHPVADLRRQPRRREDAPPALRLLHAGHAGFRHRRCLESTRRIVLVGVGEQPQLAALDLRRACWRR